MHTSEIWVGIRLLIGVGVGDDCRLVSSHVRHDDRCGRPGGGSRGGRAVGSSVLRSSRRISFLAAMSVVCGGLSVVGAPDCLVLSEWRRSVSAQGLGESSQFGFRSHNSVGCQVAQGRPRTSMRAGARRRTVPVPVPVPGLQVEPTCRRATHSRLSLSVGGSHRCTGAVRAALCGLMSRAAKGLQAARARSGTADTAEKPVL